MRIFSVWGLGTFVSSLFFKKEGKMRKYYTKVKIESTCLYFDSIENLIAFAELFWFSNANHTYLEIAASNPQEYELNTTIEV